MTVELITKQIEGCYAPLGNSGNLLDTCKKEVTKSSTAKQIDIYLAETGKLVGVIFTNNAQLLPCSGSLPRECAVPKQVHWRHRGSKSYWAVKARRQVGGSDE